MFRKSVSLSKGLTSTLLAAGVLGVIAASVFAATVEQEKFVGTYLEKIPACSVSENVDQCDGEADSLVVIAGDAKNGYRVKAELQFFNGHTCHLDAEATLRGDVLHAIGKNPPFDDCTVQIVSNGRKITFQNPSDSCSDLCGSRGSFRGYELPKVSGKADFDRSEHIRY